jgi:hypothetical protein
MLPTNPSSSLTPVTPASASNVSTGGNTEVKPLPAGPPRVRRSELPEQYESKGFWGDLKTGRWMLVPCKCLPIVTWTRRAGLRALSSFR